MALRPWNVFKKTLYATHAEGANLSITARVGLARARLQADESSGASDFGWRLSLLLPPSVAAWLLLLVARWRYSDIERLRKLEKEPGGAMLLDVLGSRVVSHLGPYQIPNLAQARLHEEPLRVLREPLLLDHERSRALSRLEQLTYRRQGAVSLAPVGEASGNNAPLQALEPLLLDMFQPSASAEASRSNPMAAAAATSHKATALRLLFDVVVALAPEDREVPPWVLDGLVAATGPPWDDGPRGEELRAMLLVLLLGSPANSQAAADLPGVCTYLQSPGMKTRDDTLWPFKSYLLSGETPDLLRRGARLVAKQRPGSIEVPPRKARDTPSLQVKHDMRSLWTTLLLTGGWAGFTAWRGSPNVKALINIAKSCGTALGGMAVLEGLWRAEERLIETPRYYNDPSYMLPCSAGMCLANCVALAWACRYSVAVPFAVCRLAKDDLMDTYRSFDL